MQSDSILLILGDELNCLNSVYYWWKSFLVVSYETVRDYYNTFGSFMRSV